MIGQFFIWPVVMHCVQYFIFLFGFTSSVHQSHTQKDLIPFFFFIFSQGRVPMLFFSSLTLTPSPLPSSSSLFLTLILYSTKLSVAVASKSCLFIQTRSIFPSRPPAPSLFLSLIVLPPPHMLVDPMHWKREEEIRHGE